MLKIQGQVILDKKWGFKPTEKGYVINGTIINIVNNKKQYISFNAWDKIAEQISKLPLESIIDIEALFNKTKRLQKLLNEATQETQEYWELGLTITKIKTNNAVLDNVNYDWNKDTDELIKDINTSAIANSQSKDEIILSDDESVLWD